ncbi:MAG TPA: ribosome maturation factor RimM [Granulicella sp.]|jgi:16S rRNA processing protein RimM
MTDPSQPSPSKSDWIAIASLLRPQGRKGELLSDLLTDLTDQFQEGRLVTLARKDAQQPSPNAVPVAIESHWLPVGKNAGRIVLKLAGCDSISQAELLAGQQVMVPAAELPDLDADTFYVADLLGCTLLDGEHAVGTIVDVQFAMGPDGKTRLPDAAPLLCVDLAANTTEDADPILIPFVRAHLESVDIDAKRIVMHLPEGLLIEEEQEEE